jgi:hypothetical protein
MSYSALILPRMPSLSIVGTINNEGKGMNDNLSVTINDRSN